MSKKYMVEIGYIDFMFDGKFEAIRFADQAFDTLTDDRSVSVKIVNIEEEGEINEA